MTDAADATHVDTIQQHRELCCVDLHALVAPNMKRSETPAFQTLVPKYEAALLKREDLCPITTTRQKHKEVAAVEILTRRTHHAAKPIKTPAHVGGHGEKEDPYRLRQADHREMEICRTSAPRYAASGRDAKQISAPPMRTATAHAPEDFEGFA